MHVLGAGAVLCCCALLFLHHRHRKMARKSTAGMALEKEDYQRQEKDSQSFEYEYEYPEQKLLLSSPEPTLFETNLTNVRNLESVPASPDPATYPLDSSDMISTSTTSSGLKIEIPRRRSYTKTIVSGGTEMEVEVTGEIVVSPEGWRRHTRVFGGGVCKACEESERRLSA